MVAWAVSWAKSIRALGIFATVVADYEALHGFIVEDFEGRMQKLEVVGRKVRNDVLVVNDSEEIGHNEMQVRGKGAVADPWATI